MILRSFLSFELSKLYKQCQVNDMKLRKILGEKRLDSSWCVSGDFLRSSELSRTVRDSFG